MLHAPYQPIGDAMPDDTKKNGRDAGNDNGVEGEVSFFNKMRSDVFRRKVEGVLKDGVIKNIAREMKLPREIVTHLISQIDETKQATLKLVSKEIRLFLENTNLSDEMAKLLSQLSFEVSTKVRFVREEPSYKNEKTKKREKYRKEKPLMKSESKEVGPSETSPDTNKAEPEEETS